MEQGLSSRPNVATCGHERQPQVEMYLRTRLTRQGREVRKVCMQMPRVELPYQTKLTLLGDSRSVCAVLLVV
jgi:hypothetical protein